MTVEEAKAVIYGNVVYACEKAGFSPHTVKLVQDACDTIIDLADRKTENSSEKPNNCEELQDWKDQMWAEAIVTEPTISKMEQVEDEPQTDTEIAKAIVHKMIDDAVIAEDAYPDLRQKMHDAVDEYEPQTDCAWR